MGSKQIFRIVSILILLGIIIPPLIFWFVSTSAPLIPASEAKQILTSSPADVIIFDPRTKEEHTDFALENSINIPLAEMTATRFEEIIELKSKKYIFVVCNSGITSSQATKKMHSFGYTKALSVKGGLDEWRVGCKSCCGKQACNFVTQEGLGTGVKFINFSFFEQLLICFLAFGIKPLYEILALIIVIMLWRSLQPEFIAIRRAMIAFFIGENACAINFLFFNEQSLFFEYLHCYGMLICFGLISYAILIFFDERLIKYSNTKDKCSLLPLCNNCYKYKTFPCTLKQFFLFALLATIIIAAMPLSAQIKSFFYIGNVFGSDTVFGHSTLQQLFEIRICPIIAILFFTAALFVLLIEKEKGFRLSKILFAIGLGPFGFSMLRFLIFWVYSHNPLWADAWEEISEFLIICGLLFVIIKRRALISESR